MPGETAPHVGLLLEELELEELTELLELEVDTLELEELDTLPELLTELLELELGGGHVHSQIMPNRAISPSMLFILCHPVV